MAGHCEMHIMLLLLFYCSFFVYKNKLGWGTVLLCTCVLTVILQIWLLLKVMAESYELWNSGTLSMSLCTPKLIFQFWHGFSLSRNQREHLWNGRGKAKQLQWNKCLFPNIFPCFQKPGLSMLHAPATSQPRPWPWPPLPRPCCDGILFACAHALTAAGLGKVSWTHLSVWSNNTCDSEVYLQQISPVPI